MQVIRVGLDVAKSVFQVHGVAADGSVTLQRRLPAARSAALLRASAALLVGLEACSACHYWARELIKLGHDIRMMPARYVKRTCSAGSDALDAQAICKAVSRPTMRFAAVKTVEQQSALTLHRSREILVKQEMMLANLLAVAIANKAARIIWALLARGGIYRRHYLVLDPQRASTKRPRAPVADRAPHDAPFFSSIRA